MFLVTFILFAFDVMNFVTVIATTFIHNPTVSLAQRYANAEARTFHFATVTDALYAYMTTLGDTIIIWRVYAFWGHGRQRWVLFILWALLFGSVVTDILLTYCVGKLGTQIFDGAFKNPAFCRDIQTTSYAMPAATTFAATVLIGTATWEYIRTVKPDLRRVSNMTRVEKVMLLLVESGFVLFKLAQVIGNIPSVSSGISTRADLGFADLVFSYSTSIIVGWYPTLVVIIAHSQHTVMDSSILSTISTMHATIPEIYLTKTRLDASSSEAGIDQQNRSGSPKVAELVEEGQSF
ncbi:hypothetical protein H0H92_004304 [Tricholoma furcatifolium]|nr:hypothetical protein H0H92_004304 [Tricholoma furcatifolium]